MKRPTFNTIVIAAATAVVFAMSPPGEARADTGFTYQGRLMQAGEPYHGSANMSFALFDSPDPGATPIGAAVALNNVSVNDGLFTVQLDFGTAAFDNSQRWLGMTINGTPLDPRQPITRAPYAIQTRGIFVNDAGRVGIGTTDPEHQLHIVGPNNVSMVYAENNWITIRGIHTASGTFPGVQGETNSESNGASGVRGFINSMTPGNNSAGVFGHNKGSGDLGFGVRGLHNGAGVGVFGEALATFGRGVEGFASSAKGPSFGVYGESAGSLGRGVYGLASVSSGSAWGVWGEAASSGGTGVYGLATASDRTQARGVWGQSNSTLGTGVFGNAQRYGVHGSGTGPTGVGVYGIGESTTGVNYGGNFHTWSTSGIGVQGHAIPQTGTTYGVRGSVNSPDGYAAYFHGVPGSANYFQRSVGIGTDNPGFQLHLSQNSAAKPTSNTWTISSDARLKKNIHTIDGGAALGDLLALRGVTYQWIDPDSQGGMDGTYTGFIAQEVEPVFPEWITEDEGGYKHLTVIGFEGLVVEALRELRDEKDAEIALLRRENENLNARLDALTQLVERLATTQKETLK